MTTKLKESLAALTAKKQEFAAKRVKLLEDAAGREDGTDLSDTEEAQLADWTTEIEACENRIALANRAIQARADLDATIPVDVKTDVTPDVAPMTITLADTDQTSTTLTSPAVRKGIDTRFFRIRSGTGVAMSGDNGVQVKSEARIYQPVGNGERIADCYLAHRYHGKDGRFSYMLDLMASANGDIDALERLNMHNKQEKEDTSWFKQDWKSFATGTSNLDGFIVPGFFTELYGGYLYTGRPTANICRQHELRGKTNTLPKSSGRTTAGKADEGVAPTSTDFSTDDVQADMQIMRGWVDVTRESISQPFSDLAESVVLEDLIMDYNQNVNQFVLDNNSTNQKGIVQEAGTSEISATNASRFAAWQVYNKILQAISKISTDTAKAADIIILSPQVLEQLRTLASAGDWPLLGRDAGTARNIVGIGPAAPDGPGMPSVGDIQMIPAIQDWSIPGNSSSTGQVIVACRDELHLFGGNSPMAARYDSIEAKSGKITFVVHGYIAFTCARWPAAIAKVSGTGLKSA